jgi:hypothetical protein
MHEKIFTIRSATTPLYRITLKPGQTARFNNLDSTEAFVINNNSGVDSASYYLRNKDDTTPIGDGEQPSAGAITIPEDTVISVTAAPGDDLKLWLPQDWANVLLRPEPINVQR